MDNMIDVKIKLLFEDSCEPLRVHNDDAGMDLYLHSAETDPVTGNIVCHSGIAVEIPDGYVGVVCSRSSVYKTGMMLNNGIGIIDAGYRGEIMARFSPVGNEICPYNIGERFCQLLILPAPKVRVTVVDQLSESSRGTGGYGSSGSR